MNVTNNVVSVSFICNKWFNATPSAWLYDVCVFVRERGGGCLRERRSNVGMWNDVIFMTVLVEVD